MSILAVDIGGSKLVCALVSADGVLLERRAAVPVTGLGRDALFDCIRRESCELLEKKGAKASLCGVSIPGLADRKNGVWVYAPFSGIRDFPIASLLSREINLPVIIENDVNACAAAEYLYGACRGVGDFLWITVSNGIGGAIYTAGKLYAGCGGTAGEIGHVRVETENPARCGCGAAGCLEAQASGAALPGIYKGTTGRDKTAKEIADLARSGDSFAIAAYEKIGYYIGKAAAGAISLLNPACVVIGGGVSGAYDLFAPALERTAREMCFLEANAGVRFLPTALGYHAALYGAAAITQMKE